METQARICKMFYLKLYQYATPISMKKKNISIFEIEYTIVYFILCTLHKTEIGCVLEPHVANLTHYFWSLFTKILVCDT